MSRPSDEQRRLAESLERLGQDAAASFYRDGCRMMVEPQRFETTSHLVSHALRETESAIRKSLIGFLGAPPHDSPNEEEAVRLLATIEKSPRSKFYRRVLQMARTADERTRKGTHRAEIERIVQITGASDDLAQAWLRLTGFTRDEDGRPTQGLHARAHRNQLGRPRAVGDEFEAVWRQAEVFLRKVVAHLEARFDLVLFEVERLLTVDAPTREDAGLLVASALRSPPALTQFLDRLNGPLWVAQLIKVGLFARPTGRVRDEDEGSTWYPVWPPSRFIRRVAGDQVWPDDIVAEALLAVPPTNNQRVVGDLVDAAKRLPGTLVAEWARTRLAGDVLGALDTPLHFNSFADISELAAHLAREREAGAALDVVRALYRLTPPPEPDPEAFWPSKDPGTLASSSFYYRNGLRDDLPAVASVVPWEVLEFLADQVDAYTGWTTDDVDPDDGSEHWLDDVGVDDDGSSMYETGAWLARALCRTALGVAAGETPPSGVITWLLARERHVYIRCALTVAREHGTASDVASLLSDRDRVFDRPLWEETARLVEARFGDLSEADRQLLLDLLADGPRTGWFVERAERNGWPAVTLAQAQEWSGEIQRHVLSRLRTVLPEAWVAEHAGLFPEQTEPEQAEPDPSQETLVRIEALLASDPEAGMRELAEWELVEHPPSIEAAASSLERAVRADRTGFARAADSLIGADATMVRRFVDGLSERADGADEMPEDIEWEPVLRLAAWSAQQPYEIAGREGRDRDGDRDWRGAWKRIARMLDRALRADAIPWRLRDLVWYTLRPLTDAPDPEPGDPDDTARGAASRALDRTRGDAMSAVLGYVAWAQWATDDAPSAVPEAFEVLDAHLDPEVDRSPAIRAVYGKNIPLLMWAAGPWLRERRDLLFPDDEALRLGTWDGYGYTQRRATETIEFLRPAYLAELERLGDGDLVEILYPDEPFLRQERVRDEVRRWAAQIADAYLLGSSGLGDGDLGAALFGHSSSEVRALAVRQVGRLLRESWGGHAPGVLGERVVRAWEWMRERFELTPDVGEAFAAWPPINRLDSAWSLPHLVEALAASRGETREGHRLIEWLAADDGHDPALAVRVLDLLVQAERGHLYGQEAEMRTILRRAAEAGGEARALARQAVNRILVRSHVDLSDALAGPDTDGE
ncbi:hypothetical protein [Rubricoccus marinus]|uniref:Uncharacterized protein n=1 Tax=Rubricoccus marinus TaxID=716817 RepID=A0A259TTZ5_9BACT|nr:hypothetical protein [Rubricoccus marinus]OZC01193.1 hypothetical protein BSZ36_18220 [Rubricoccus marinus]